ncbi:MAG: MarR family transcriptional regulator [Actinomycetota bacterium]|nr:MarR family transcriptional regulator [Actinomycetota bacterium]
MAPVTDDRLVTTFGMLLEAHATLVGAVRADLDTDLDMPLSWFDVLIRLSRSPHHRLRMTELATQVGLSASGLTRLVDRIEEAGLVRREACPSDRRSTFAVLAAPGEEALTLALPAHIASLRRHLQDPLGGDGLAQLEALLRSLRDCAR